jgi:hypothetical protein
MALSYLPEVMRVAGQVRLIPDRIIAIATPEMAGFVSKMG